MNSHRPRALVTAASTSMGFALAARAANCGHELLLVGNDPDLNETGSRLWEMGAVVNTLYTDLTTIEGNRRVLEELRERPASLFLTQIGQGLRRMFREQDSVAVRDVIESSLASPLYLTKEVALSMRDAGHGRILLIEAIEAQVPRPYEAMYESTISMVNSFAGALRSELLPHGVTITTFLPSSGDAELCGDVASFSTEWETWAEKRAEKLAELTYGALMRGEPQVVTGWKNKLLVAMAKVVPAPFSRAPNQSTSPQPKPVTDSQARHRQAA